MLIHLAHTYLYSVMSYDKNESAFSEGNKQFIPGNDPGVKVLSLIF